MIVQCISCGEDSFSKYVNDSYFHLPVSKCTSCGMLVTGQQNDRTQINMYDSQYWEERNAKLSIDSNYADTDSQGKRRNWLSQYAYCKEYFGAKKEILEIGSGAGQATYWFDKLGHHVTGIEPDKRNVEQINKKLENSKCISEYIENLHIEKQFDIIWMSHVLEHLANPDIFLKNIKQNLKQDGVFFIEVPNCDNKTLLDSTIKTEPHFFHFTKNSLINICKNAGFTIKKCDAFRPATKLEGALNKIYKKINSRNNPYAYYPRIICDSKIGRDLRIILSH